MRRSPRIALTAALAIMVVAGIGSPGAGAAGAASTCGVTWGSLAHQSGQGPAFPPISLLAVRAGEHPCYDRIVFDLDGPASGYRVAYGQVLTQGQGLPLALRGGASLSIVLFASTYDSNGVPTYSPADPGNLADVGGFRTFRQVAFGGSFEGYTTIGLGVRARLPFQVFNLAGPGAHSRVVVDVAHQW